MKWKSFLPLLVMVILFSACKKEETLSYTNVNAYAPFEAGRYIIYKLDSTVFTNFGVTREVHTYEVKYTVDEVITDNEGDSAYRIIRSIRTDNSQSFIPDATFMAKHTGNSMEWVENNLRFIKLRQPVREGYSWKGNSYFDTQSQFSHLNYMDDWDYRYEQTGVPLMINGFNFPNTITIAQRDEIIGTPDDPRFYSEVNFSKEIFAEGVGMVYKEFLHTEYQPPTTPGGSGYYTDESYGVKLEVIEFN